MPADVVEGTRGALMGANDQNALPRRKDVQILTARPEMAGCAGGSHGARLLRGDAPLAAEDRAEHLIQRDWVPYRVAPIGSYNADLGLKREINRFLLSEDPSGTLELIELGIARGEIRKDVDPEMLASMVDWLADLFKTLW